MSHPIPQPPGIPLLGNIADLDPQNGFLSLIHLSEKYGEIFKLSILGADKYYISSVELLNELCDEKRFCKCVAGSLEQLRNGVGDGLFSAYHGEHNWEIAHRTLIPAFGPLSIQGMYDEMYDIATQLVAKWARMGPDQVINATDDYTRLTLDSIGLCAMDTRFNSFYTEHMHPFVDAMTGFMVESGRRVQRTRIGSLFNRAADHQYQQDIANMKIVAQEVINHRRANPSPKKDLLNALLYGQDPKTGEHLLDDNIMNNMISFLIAGHETTSGLLSFASYDLLKNPEAFRKAQEEVDAVVGKGPVKYQDLSKLPYIEAILRETLRLHPTAPGFTVQPLPTSSPVVLGGKYTIGPDAKVTMILSQVGRDPSVFGKDADEFKPERMYGDNFKKLPPNAWKPFGNGVRGCIGRPFAWVEATLALTLILQNFNLRLADPSYNLQIKQTLTIKPDHLAMYATLREGIDPITLERKMFAGVAENKKKVKTAAMQSSSKPITVLYGSNSGTCEGLAQNFAGSAASHGYTATVKPLDAATDKFPIGEPVIIITSSYEGSPPDNAASFVEWLKAADSTKFKGSHVAVFGCGHHDWVATYQKIPTLISSQLADKGATVITPLASSDVAAGTVFDDFDEWQDQLLWPALCGDNEGADVAGLDMEISTTTRASHLRHNVRKAVVVQNHAITPPGMPEKRHLEFKLPTNLVYEAGDYLAILPINDFGVVSRILRRFSLPFDATMKLRRDAHTTIPTESDITVSAVLSSYVELNTPASKKNISIIAKFSPEESKKRLAEFCKSESVLDILEACPAVELPFPIFLSMLIPMRLRQYSIASSPLKDPTTASITYSVADDQAGHLGVASNYLKSLQVSSTAQVMIKKSHASFHLPLDNKTPIIMIAAGTGMAPFRGFIQERATKITAGTDDLGKALLFVGCRYPEKDQLHHQELKKWEELGAVKVFWAFSRDPEKSEGCKYVQDRIWREQEGASKLFAEGAKAYICGSSALGKSVADLAARIGARNAEEKGTQMTHEEGLKWWEGLRGERYAVDVFD